MADLKRVNTNNIEDEPETKKQVIKSIESVEESSSPFNESTLTYSKTTSESRENEQVSAFANQAGADPLRVTERQSAHSKYLSRITFEPTNSSGNLLSCLADLEQPLSSHLTTILESNPGIKLNLDIGVQYESLTDTNKLIDGHLQTCLIPLFSSLEIPQGIAALYHELIQKNDNFIRERSGLVLKKITEITLSVSEHHPLAGLGFQPLPPFLAKKKCIINVKNDDNRCFGYALLSFLEPCKDNPSKPYSYNKFFIKHHLDTLTYPVKLTDVPAIEATLPLSINVFGFDDDAGTSRFPLYISHKADVPIIDLLYWNDHYALINDFNRFMSDITKHHGRKYFCRRCFGHFTSEAVLSKHQKFCLGFNGCKTNLRFPPANSICEFKNMKNQLKCPFVIYADFECLLPLHSNQESNQGNTIITQQHVPSAVGFKLVGPDLRTATNQDPHLNFANYPFEKSTGPDSAEWFLTRMAQIETEIMKVICDVKTLEMSEEETRAFEAATKCHICEKGWDLNEIQEARVPMNEISDSAAAADVYVAPVNLTLHSMFSNVSSIVNRTSYVLSGYLCYL